MKTLNLTRWPLPTLMNLFLACIPGALLFSIWLSFEWGNPVPFLFIGGASFFWFVIAAAGASHRRLRLEVTDTHLRVYSLHGRRAVLRHEVLRQDLKDLWLRELHPVRQGPTGGRGTSNRLSLMVRTSQDIQELICLRDGLLNCYRLDALLLWLAEALALPKGVPQGPLRRAGR